jgi:CheY-like chemotaxis protein
MSLSRELLLAFLLAAVVPLVDDSPHDTELVLDALAQHHLANRVLALRDGAEALDYLYRRGPFAGRTTGQPAVILLDLKMPKVDGIEVLRELKNDPELGLIPVVMMTSSREEQDLLDSYRLGVNAYVVKPLDFHQFADAVEKVGAFWAVVNEPPPRSVPSPGDPRVHPRPGADPVAETADSAAAPRTPGAK